MNLEGAIAQSIASGSVSAARAAIHAGPKDREAFDKFMNRVDEMGANYVLNLHTGIYHELDSKDGNVLRESYWRDTTTCQVAEIITADHAVPFKTKQQMKEFSEAPFDDQFGYIKKNLAYLVDEKGEQHVKAMVAKYYQEKPRLCGYEGKLSSVD